MGTQNTQVVDVPPAPAIMASFTVYRPNSPNPMKINGANLYCDVRGDSLIFFNRSGQGPEAIAYVFGPGQWLTVNTPPRLT